jgi:hypothetical protein
MYHQAHYVIDKCRCYKGAAITLINTLDKAVTVSTSALRSYQYGNADPGLAKMVADYNDSLSARRMTVPEYLRAIADQVEAANDPVVAARLRDIADRFEQMEKAIPEPDKLETLANWYDLEQTQRPEWKHHGVQEELRRWAQQGRVALAAARKEIE